MMTKMNRRAMWFVLLLLMGQAFAAEEVANISVPAGKVIGLQAVSEKHDVAFATVQLAGSPTKPRRSFTVTVDLKTGKTVPFGDPDRASKRIRISPCGEYVMGTIHDNSWWVYNLSTKVSRKCGSSIDIPTPGFMQWWGSNIVSAGVENRKDLVALRIVSAKSGNVVSFPRIYGIPLAGSPDGEQLAIMAFDKDIKKPVDLRALSRSPRDTYLICLDKQGKVLSTKTITKGPFAGPLKPLGRVLFSPKGQRLIGTLSDAEKASVHKAISEGGEAALLSVVSMASVTDLKGGKQKTVPVAAMTGIRGFDGHRVVQNVMIPPANGSQWVVGEVGQKKLRKFAELGPMDRRRSCVEQTAKGMTIYFLEPGKNVIRKILVKGAMTHPWILVAKKLTVSGRTDRGNPASTRKPADTGNMSSRPNHTSRRKRSLRSTSRKMTTSTSGKAKGKVQFYGSGGESNRVVFLIDANGSMVDAFGSVRNELLRSIGRLRGNMEFSVIVMTGDKIKAFPAKGFQKASLKGKMAANGFLEKITAAGQTKVEDGVKEVLKRLGKSDEPSQVFVAFGGTTTEEATRVLEIVNEAKLPKTVKINTVYLGKRSKEAADVLSKIAEATGGSYRRVPPQK